MSLNRSPGVSSQDCRDNCVQACLAAVSMCTCAQWLKGDDNILCVCVSPSTLETFVTQTEGPSCCLVQHNTWTHTVCCTAPRIHTIKTYIQNKCQWIPVFVVVTVKGKTCVKWLAGIIAHATLVDIDHSKVDENLTIMYLLLVQVAVHQRVGFSCDWFASMWVLHSELPFASMLSL